MIWLVAAFCILALSCGFIGWRAPKWPQGETYTKQYRQFKVRVVFSEGVEIEKPVKALLVERTARAVYAASYGWALSRTTVSGWQFHRKRKTICVLFRSREFMDRLAKNRLKPTKEMFAYLKKVKHGLHYIPLIVVSESQVNRVLLTGEPVIHEMMHFLSNTYIQSDTIHDDPTVWSVSEPLFRESAQSIGRSYFTQMIKEF